MNNPSCTTPWRTNLWEDQALHSCRLTEGLALSYHISSSRWTAWRTPHPAVEFWCDHWRHLHALLLKPSVQVRETGEAACLSLGIFSQHSFSIPQIEGPAYYILNSLSSHITLMWYHFSILECHNKKEVLEHDSTCQSFANTYLKYWIKPVSCDISGGNLSL